VLDRPAPVIQLAPPHPWRTLIRSILEEHASAVSLGGLEKVVNAAVEAYTLGGSGHQDVRSVPRNRQRGSTDDRSPRDRDPSGIKLTGGSRMPSTSLTRRPRTAGPPRAVRSTRDTAASELRRRLAQTCAALEASRRDNAALRRTVERLLTANQDQTNLPAPRRAGAHRRQRTRQAALADPCSRNP
jgi:hypothetical protein